jgi:hypothetical protein
MYRCTSTRATSARVRSFVAAALVAVIAAPLALPAHAQMQRNFPADALRGRIRFLQPPDIELNGQPQRLAPGSRVRDQNNMIAMSAALAMIDQRFFVDYNFDNLGMVKDVWILTDAERAVRPWPTSLKEAQSWTFDPIAQTWTKP